MNMEVGTKKWDMLLVNSGDGYLALHSTNAEESKDFAEIVVQEAKQYFAYVEQKGKKLDIHVNQQSNKGHKIYIVFHPHTNYLAESDKAIFDIDFRYFLLNLVISHDWLPYPGDGEGVRFIRYYE